MWHDKSPATQSRWQWTWVWDDSVFQKYGEQLGLVGTVVERPAQARVVGH